MKKTYKPDYGHHLVKQIKDGYDKFAEKHGWKKPVRWTKRRILQRKDEDHEQTIA